jgi:hypothetical protein
VDSASMRARRGGPCGANPVDRGKPGSKLQLVCDGGGRLQVRWDWDSGRWCAFVLVACAVVWFNRL